MVLSNSPSDSSFDPLEFLRAADNLAMEEDECSLRIAVGRSYYALFLFSREKLKVLAIENVHTAVLQAMGRRDPHMNNLLFDLHRLRKVADYELIPLHDKDKNWKANWIRHKKLCDKLLPQLHRLQ